MKNMKRYESTTHNQEQLGNRLPGRVMRKRPRDRDIKSIKLGGDKVPK